MLLLTFQSLGICIYQEPQIHKSVIPGVGTSINFTFTCVCSEFIFWPTSMEFHSRMRENSISYKYHCA